MRRWKSERRSPSPRVSDKGKYEGKGQIRLHTNRRPITVTCSFRSTATETTLSLNGKCRGLVVVSRSIDADPRVRGPLPEGYWHGTPRWWRHRRDPLRRPPPWLHSALGCRDFRGRGRIVRLCPRRPILRTEEHVRKVSGGRIRRRVASRSRCSGADGCGRRYTARMRRASPVRCGSA